MKLHKCDFFRIRKKKKKKKRKFFKKKNLSIRYHHYTKDFKLINMGNSLNKRSNTLCRMRDVLINKTPFFR
ncbi:uncharacterized protein OCT59_003380 [Rhizophagus irregularis]|uniref:uncharacterized protein n=1 Tax=Rhizophagus irregularis TaxID=588596 RepID=UPI003318C55C|nr:hypothetical protein OCT59_003380 [Rhizophagus irregularis]